MISSRAHTHTHTHAHIPHLNIKPPTTIYSCLYLYAKRILYVGTELLTQKSQDQSWALSCCVTLNKSLYLSELQFPPINSIYKSTNFHLYVELDLTQRMVIYVLQMQKHSKNISPLSFASFKHIHNFLKPGEFYESKEEEKNPRKE